jgi:hypothetical protein
MVERSEDRLEAPSGAVFRERPLVEKLRMTVDKM